VAKMLEHQPKPGAQLAVQRTWPAQVMETRDHGRSHTIRAQGGPFAIPSSPQVRHTLSDVCAVCQSSAQPAWSFRRRRCR